VNCRQRGQIKRPGEELVAHGAEEPLHFALGRAVPHGGVVEQAADPGANLDQLLGDIDGAVVHIERGGHAAFVEGGAPGGDEGVHVFLEEELAVAAHPGGVVKERDQAGLDRRTLMLHMRAVKRVGLP